MTLGMVCSGPVEAVPWHWKSTYCPNVYSEVAPFTPHSNVCSEALIFPLATLICFEQLPFRPYSDLLGAAALFGGW